MDPDLIRLILLICGVALVAGIYFWDRIKRSQPTSGAQRRRKSRNAEPTVADVVVPEPEATDPPVNEAESTQPPVADPAADPVTVATAEDDAYTPGPGRQSSSKASAAPQGGARPLDPEPSQVDSWSMSAGDDDPQFSMDLAFDAHDDGDYLHGDPALEGSVEHLIVAIGISAVDSEMSGEAVMAAASEAGMRAGEMSIFHCHDPNTDKVLFSMASMVEPGTFPFDDLAKFTTPGLTVFTQLPGARDGVEIFDRMLSTADQMAKSLNAEIQDDRRNKLTGQMREHLRESIVEHRQRVRLARSRH